MRIQDLIEYRNQTSTTHRSSAYVDHAGHQEVTQNDLSELEKMIDSLFNTIGIDVSLSQIHFVQRMNDIRGPTTTKEVGDLFRKAFAKYGKLLAKSGPELQAVLTDLQSNTNVPFALEWNRDKEMLDLYAKTVMKKKGFRTRNKKLFV